MDGVTAYLLTQGILGVVALVEGIVVLRLYNKTERLEKEKSDLQEARRLDAVETRTDVTSILPGISQSLQNISDKIEISRSNARNRS
jgi:hypothetical protein